MVFLLWSGNAVYGQSVPAIPSPSPSKSSVSAGDNNDDRVKKLEEQLQAQQEQNKQILEMLNKMKTSPAAQTPAAPAGASASAPSSTPSAAPQNAGPSPQKDEAKFVHGWVAKVFPLGADARDNQTDELGRFTATKDSYRFRDALKETGIRSGADIGIKGEAFLEVTETGRHTFSFNFIHDNNWNNTGCFVSIKVEGQVVAQGTNLLGRDEIKSVIGGADLEPGRYKTEFWGVCGPMANGVIHSTPDRNEVEAATAVSFEFLIKKPSDPTPVSANKVLVIKVQK
jgi:hypothetical protein